MKETASFRQRLREVTKPAHERLHFHPGFAAAASGRISMCDYAHLLSRLFGYHSAFESAQQDAARRGVISASTGLRARSPLIAADLETLGFIWQRIRALPRCAAVRPPRSQAEWLGGLYVLEGSTLGGVQIARALQSLLPSPEGDGRRFFLGYGDRHGVMWRSLVDELEKISTDSRAASEALVSATKTFQEFEHWMEGWKPEFSPTTELAIDPAR